MRRLYLYLFLIVPLIDSAQIGNVGIGTPTPDQSALLELSSSKMGFLTPRMNTMDRTAIANPADGLLVYDTTVGCLFFYNQSSLSWVSLCQASGGTGIGISWTCTAGVGGLQITPSAGAPYTVPLSVWHLGGSSIGPSDYFGTANNDDIRIGTNNGSCSVNPLKEKMIIGSDANSGNVAIGWDGVTALPVPASNNASKFSVQNGIVSTAPYATLMTLANFHPSDVAIYAYANKVPTDGFNVGMAAAADNTTASVNLGFQSAVQSSPFANIAFAGNVTGNGTQYTPQNFGLICHVQGNAPAPDPNTINAGCQVNVQGDNQPTSGNTGYHTYVWGTGSRNTGSWSDALSPAGAATANDIDLGAGGVVSTINYDPIATLFVQGSRIGVYGSVQPPADGAANYGVWGDLSAMSPPAGNTNPYYAIYGIAPASIGSGTNVNITLGNNNANCYAGYFVGDVFCSNTYYYSDPKLKENIAEYKGALDKLNQLPVKSYTFRQNEFPTMNFPQGEQIGMLSTDIKQVFPNLVKQTTQPAIKGKGGDVAFEAVNYNSLIPVLVQAVKELDLKTQSHAPTDDLLHTISAQQAQLTRQAQQIADQDRKIDNLHAMLEDLHRSENSEAENQKDHDAVLYPAVFDSVTHSVSIDYRVDRMHTESSIRVETKEGTLISQQDISRHNIGTLLFPLSMLANVGCKYSLVIDGKIVDTRSMMIPSK